MVDATTILYATTILFLLPTITSVVQAWINAPVATTASCRCPFGHRHHKYHHSGLSSYFCPSVTTKKVSFHSSTKRRFCFLRRRDALLLSKNDDDAHEASALINDEVRSNNTYSRTFPRYKIPFSGGSSRSSYDEERKVSSSLLPSFLGDWQLSRMRQGLERRYSSATDGQFHWVEEAQKGDDGHGGVRLLATLWGAAADAATPGGRKEEPSVSVWAFPGSIQKPEQTNIIQQWINLWEWLQQHEQEEGGDATTTTSNIQVEYWIESNLIPCLKLTRKQRLQHQQEPSSSSSSSSLVEEEGIVNKRTKSWVKRVLVDMQICPFTRTVRRSGQGLANVGVQVADIDYRFSQATNVVQLMADTWGAIANMLNVGPKRISSILLAAPYFDNYLDLWCGPIFALLEAGVVVANAEKSGVGVVCFHPYYQTPDGTTFPGFGHMHSVPRLTKWVQETTSSNKGRTTNKNVDDLEEVAPKLDLLSAEQIAAGGAWQRRTPHATINVLRADQLQAAEGKRNTPLLYTRNIAELVVNVGLEKLHDDLNRERELR